MAWLIKALAQQWGETGIKPKTLEGGLAEFRRLCADNLPHGVSHPVPVPLELFTTDPMWPLDERVRLRGRWLAQKERTQGTVRLYTPNVVPSYPQLASAIPLVQMPEAATDPRAAQLLSARYAETWRLLREEGAPAGSGLAWTRELFDLPALWKNPGKRAIRLREGKEVHLSPDGVLRAEGDQFRRLDGHLFLGLSENMCFPRPVDRWTRPSLPYADELIWGPPGTAVVYVRCGTRWSNTEPQSLYAYDLRSGLVLNAVARHPTSVPAPRLPRINS